MNQAQINTSETAPARKSPEAIVEMVARRHKLEARDIMGECRYRPIMLARREAMVELHLAHPEWSYPRLGRELGGRDHTTIMHGLKMAGVWRPQATRHARAARVIGKFIAKYEAVADMKEHAACCAIAKGISRLFKSEGI